MSDLVVGSIRGFRRWRLYLDGMLSSWYHHVTSWEGPELDAICTSYQEHRLRENHPELLREMPCECDYCRSTINLPVPPVPLLGCGCGIYGIYDVESDGFQSYVESAQNEAWMRGWSARRSRTANNFPVVGVIEGTGRTLLGSTGFRTQHARIVSLYLNPGMQRYLEPTVAALKRNYPTVTYYTSAERFMVESNVEIPKDLLTISTARLLRPFEGG